jgi:hypothetical protein
MDNKTTAPRTTVMRDEINGNEKIYWRADNLQDSMTMEALREAIERHGSLKVMKHIQNLS